MSSDSGQRSPDLHPRPPTQMSISRCQRAAKPHPHGGISVWGSCGFCNLTALRKHWDFLLLFFTTPTTPGSSDPGPYSLSDVISGAGTRDDPAMEQEARKWRGGPERWTSREESLQGLGRRWWWGTFGVWAGGRQQVGAGEGAFPCQACGKRFAWGPSLSTHRRTHTREKPFVGQMY